MIYYEAWGQVIEPLYTRYNMLRIYWYCDSWEGWIGGNPPNYCYKKVISGSKDIVKSADTEGVELSSYPDSSGAIDSPPEVEMLVGGNNARENQRKRDHCLMVDATFNYHVPQK